MIGTTTPLRGAAVGSGSEAGWLEVGVASGAEVVSGAGVVVVWVGWLPPAKQRKTYYTSISQQIWTVSIFVA